MSSHRLTIFVRHPLERDAQELLDALGAMVVVDPDAPSCAIGTAGGKRRTACPRCRELDAGGARAARAIADELSDRARQAKRHR